MGDRQSLLEVNTSVIEDATSRMLKALKFWCCSGRADASTAMCSSRRADPSESIVTCD